MNFRIALLVGLLCASAAQAATAPSALPNKNAFHSSPAAVAMPAAPLQQALRGSLNRGGYRSEVDRARGLPTFLWAPPGAAAPAVGALKRDALPESRARAWLGQQAGLLGLGRDALDEAELVEVSDRGAGSVIVRFRQRLGGVEVFNRRLNVMLDRGGRPVAVSGYFARTGDADAPARGGLDAAQAIGRGIEDLGGGLIGGLSRLGGKGDFALFRVPRLADGFVLTRAPRAKPVYFELGDRLEPAFYLELVGEQADGRGQFGYGYVVSAQSGEVLFRNRLIASDFSYRVFADTTGDRRPFDAPLGNDYLPSPALPGEELARNSATAALLTLNHGPIGNDDPWLPDGATTTQGNHANAYLDLAAPDGYNAGSDIMGQVSSDASFDYPIAADLDPSGDAARQAAIVNLFYVNNWLHDLYYAYGFDERSGNAQADNYGRGGIDGDALNAEGQDSSGRSNANMLTPADGSAPRMQMYLFDGPLTGVVQLTAPDPLAAELSDLKFSGASFGPGEFDVSGAAERADELSAIPSDGCLGIEIPVTGTGVPALPQASLFGKIAIIDRGNCSFTTKAQFATLSGAIAMVVVDNGDGDPIPMGNADLPINIPGVSTDPLYVLPSVMIRKDDGQKIKDAIAAGATVSMRLLREPATDVDGTLDNMVIAHEYFHYVSNRLVGDGSGLNNNQGGSMGEGWGDFSSLLIALRENDSVPGLIDGAYATGFYVIPDYFFGIRRLPYSTDFSKNCLTFRHIESGVPLPTDLCPVSFGGDGASNSEVHNAGEIWANMLWESYVALVKAHGYGEGRVRMIGYLIDGLKMTPTSPTYTEARDGLLAAAAATDVADFGLIARAFAKRGLGVEAVSPARDSTDHAGVVESYVALEASVPSLGLVEGDGCDMDGVLDAGETAMLTVSLLNNGGYAPGSTVLFDLGSDAAALSFGSETLSFTVGEIGALSQLAVQVSLAADAAGPVELPIRLSLILPASMDEAVRYPDSVSYSLPADYDVARTANSDDFEHPLISEPDWTRLSAGTTERWELVDEDELLGSGTVWFAPDRDSSTDLSLVTPAFSVPADGRFSIEWDHYYSFEPRLPIPLTADGYDGGVVEVRIDGGDWIDVTEAGGSFIGAGYTGTISALDGREGFASSTAGLLGGAALAHEGVDFGTALAGHLVNLRFRVVSDELVGDYGWAIDQVSVAGASEPPFLAVTADQAECLVEPPDDGAGDAGDAGDDGGSDDDDDDGDAGTGGDDGGSGGDDGDADAEDGSSDGGDEDGSADDSGAGAGDGGAGGGAGTGSDDSGGADGSGDDDSGGDDDTGTDGGGSGDGGTGGEEGAGAALGSDRGGNLVTRAPTDHGGAMSWSWLGLATLIAMFRRRAFLGFHRRRPLRM